MTTTKTSIFLFCLFTLSISLWTCIDAIDFAQPATIQNAISIQGKLTKGNPSRVEVQISEVFNFSGVPRLIDALSVALIDDSGNEVALASKIQGVYNLDLAANLPVKVAYGTGYQIRVVLNNGEIYESVFDTLYPVTTPTELSVLKTQEVKTNTFGVEIRLIL